MRLLGVIPARAGSKRLPNKNLAPLGGEPLLAHTCRAARAAAICDALYVNTDCPQIAAVATAAGVACPALRPAEFARDDTPTQIAMRWLIEWLEQHGETYDALLILQPTSPLRHADDIREAGRLFRRVYPRSVVSVTPVAPAHWLGTLDGAGDWNALPPGSVLHRLNGAIYFHALDRYLAGLQGTRRDASGASPIAYVMPVTRGLDIDTPADLLVAEQLLRQPGSVSADELNAAALAPTAPRAEVGTTTFASAAGAEESGSTIAASAGVAPVARAHTDRSGVCA